jgi:HTH-type transcriptional repressor of NAD biosynthesis genes
LPDTVKRYFQKKVVLVGTESTGKTTLAQYLSKMFRSILVHEAGRDLIPDSNEFTIAQLQQIGEIHAQNILEAMQQLEPIIFIDTDIHITQSYSKYKFGEYLTIPDSVYNINRSDLYLYLNNETPFIQDGTRLNEGKRNALDQLHRETLAHFGIEFVEVSGNYDQRKQKAIKLVRNLFNHFH